MKRWRVLIGTPDGRHGDSLLIRANDAESAGFQAMDQRDMRIAATWVVLSVTEEGAEPVVAKPVV